MTRKELIHLLVLQARANGFEFRKWYLARIGSEWTSAEAAVETLARGSRYYALLFSHDFARHFWKPGSQIQFVVPTQEFKQLNRNREEITVVRKAHTRRTARENSWEYHLREMAASDEPLRYIRRFAVTEEELTAQRSDQTVEVLAEAAPEPKPESRPEIGPDPTSQSS
jgi:hypothetical protein